MSLMGAAMIDRMNAEREAEGAAARERQVALVLDAEAFARAVRYLQRARASNARTGARELTWRDAEVALHGRIGTLNVLYQRAVDALTPKVAG